RDIEDRVDRTLADRDATLQEAALEKLRELIARDWADGAYEAEFVKGAVGRARHVGEESRVGAREDVADMTVLLHRGADLTLGFGAARLHDLLEFVEEDADRTLGLSRGPVGAVQDFGEERHTRRLIGAAGEAHG